MDEALNEYNNLAEVIMGADTPAELIMPLYRVVVSKEQKRLDAIMEVVDAMAEYERSIDVNAVLLWSRQAQEFLKNREKLLNTLRTKYQVTKAEMVLGDTPAAPTEPAYGPQTPIMTPFVPPPISPIFGKITTTTYTGGPAVAPPPNTFFAGVGDSDLPLTAT